MLLQGRTGRRRLTMAAGIAFLLFALSTVSTFAALAQNSVAQDAR